MFFNKIFPIGEGYPRLGEREKLKNLELSGIWIFLISLALSMSCHIWPVQSTTFLRVIFYYILFLLFIICSRTTLSLQIKAVNELMSKSKITTNQNNTISKYSKQSKFAINNAEYNCTRLLLLTLWEYFDKHRRLTVINVYECWEFYKYSILLLLLDRPS